MYLNNMLCLPVNSSPGWVFPRQNFDGRHDLMFKYLARIMAGISDFKQSLEKLVLIMFDNNFKISLFSFITDRNNL